MADVRTLVALVLVLGAAALGPAGASAAATGSIEGTVTGADTHEGIEGVEACAYTVEEGEEWWSRCAPTASDGSYAIEEVPAGEYEVAFWAEETGYLNGYYPGLVAVGSAPVTGIDIELARAANIEGTVRRSSDAEPVEEVQVCAWHLGSNEFGDCDWTGPDGSYDLEVEPGEYGIEFWPAWSGQNLAIQYFNHRDHWAEADPVTVEEGESATEVDADLGPGATISGHVFRASTGAGLEEIPVCAIDATSDELMVCNWTYEGGEYELPFLPAGEYKVVFSINFAEWFEEEEFEEDDGFPNQYWNNQATLAAANVITLTTGQSVSGIDARLGPPAPVSQPPVIVTPPPAATLPITKAKTKRCRKGFVRKKVKGRYRCVKRKKHRQRNRPARPGAFSVPSPRGAQAPPSRPLFRVVR